MNLQTAETLTFDNNVQLGDFLRRGSVYSSLQRFVDINSCSSIKQLLELYFLSIVQYHCLYVEDFRLKSHPNP
jgi:hypothetical protein